MANETDILARWEQLESDVLNPVMAAAPPPFGESTRRQLLPTLGKTSLLKQPTRHYLNQGGTGMVMEPIRNLQYLVAQLAEEQPMAYHRDIAPALMRRARESAAAYLGTSPKNLSFMASASSGFYAVMRAITFRPGDIVLTTSLRYHSFDDDLRYVCETKHSGLVEVRTVQLPLPINSSDEIVAAFKAAFDAAAVDGSLARIRLAFFDHVSSKPSVLFPVKELCTLCREHGVPSLVDGAHAPGLLCWAGDACASSAATSALRLDQLDPDYYIANFYSTSARLVCRTIVRCARACVSLCLCSICIHYSARVCVCVCRMVHDSACMRVSIHKWKTLGTHPINEPQYNLRPSYCCYSSSWSRD